MLDDITRYREMTRNFGGYNHQLTCEEGQFFDMKNMTSQYYPTLSPRGKRGIVRKFTNPQGILDKEELMWVDNGNLYINGEKVEFHEYGVELSNNRSMNPKTLVKMGAYVIIMPDKIWYNVETKEHGRMEAVYEKKEGVKVQVSLCESDGTAINWHDEAYYESNKPKDGDYMMTTVNGKSSLKIYSTTTEMWSKVASPYVQFTGSSIGARFKKGDGVKISWMSNIPVTDDGFITEVIINNEGDEEYERHFTLNTHLVDCDIDRITIPGILRENGELKESMLKIERLVPDMAFITECNNRLWGCSKDGHEIYCCKLGDVTNWNCFAGISTDSWAVTIGSDGKFTGATTFMGYPIFFKEDRLIKIAISGNGAHQIKETVCRGVQKGSERSLAILNENLYYKSSTGVCVYTGGVPASISDAFGDVHYTNAVAGTVGNRYYISMKDKEGISHMFAYDVKNGIWSREDNTEVLYFCRHGDDLFYIDLNDRYMKSVNGSLPYDVEEKKMEGDFDWFVESGTIGYAMADNKYISRINVRISLEFGTNVDFYIQYDSNDEWEHKFNMSGKGTRTFTVPVIPKRCDHFKYKLVGKGGCKVHSITKTLEQGSDI